MRELLSLISQDLRLWMPALSQAGSRQVAEQVVGRLQGADGRAELSLPDGASLSWLYDKRSGFLLVTYPDGGCAIRSLRE